MEPFCSKPDLTRGFAPAESIWRSRRNFQSGREEHSGAILRVEQCPRGSSLGEIMVIIHGISGSYAVLLNGLKPVDGRSLGNFGDIHHFYNNYTEILGETQAAVNNQLEERIAGLNDTEVQSDTRIREGTARRTAEVDGEIAEVRTKIDNATNIVTRCAYKVKCWIAVSLRSRSISRPFSRQNLELRRVQNRESDAHPEQDGVCQKGVQ